MQNWPNSNDRTLQSNSIKQSQLSYAQTSQQKNNYELVAPFDGTIDTIGFKVGDTVSYSAGSSTNGITLSNPDAYEVNMLIDQIDIVKVEPGQPVEITFDAYPDYMITWTIGSIDPTPVTNAGVVSYQAKINLQKTDGKKIYDSMSANIKVIINHKDNILILPTVAIQTSGDQTFVRTQQWTTDISVGITDWTNIEILSWLQLGEIVYAKQYQVQTTATTSTNPFQQTRTTGTWSSWSSDTNQSFRLLNGGWGGGWGYTRPGN
jgi:HlyD family secretion protein